MDTQQNLRKSNKETFCCTRCPADFFFRVAQLDAKHLSRAGCNNKCSKREKPQRAFKSYMPITLKHLCCVILSLCEPNTHSSCGSSIKRAAGLQNACCAAWGNNAAQGAINVAKIHVCRTALGFGGPCSRMFRASYCEAVKGADLEISKPTKNNQASF